MDDMAVLGLGLSTYVVFEFLDPIVSIFPVELLAIMIRRCWTRQTYSSGSNML